MNRTATAQERREASHRWLDVSSMGAAVASGGLFVAGAYVTSPVILTVATVAGIAGILGRVKYLRETEPKTAASR